MLEVRECFLGFTELKVANSEKITKNVSSVFETGVNITRLRGKGFEDACKHYERAYIWHACEHRREITKGKHYLTHCSIHCLNLVLVQCSKVQNADGSQIDRFATRAVILQLWKNSFWLFRRPKTIKH